MCEKKAVIIGAGQTGRGFIAPILTENSYGLTFLDKDESLIEQLVDEGQYTIHYFGEVKEPVVISNFDAYSVNDSEALKKLIQADVIFVSVFADNIKDLVGLFNEASQHKKEKLTIICCENGVNVKQPLIDSQVRAVVSEGIIFCTTLSTTDTLDLKSQNYPELPIDGSVDELDIEIQGMPLDNDFKSLIQRKIYTYNFLSAVIAYLGSYLGYESYGEAANDPAVVRMIDILTPIISSIISKEYRVSYDEQFVFTNLAVEKFKNKEIADTIYRNARQAVRKLTPNERLLTPLRLAQKYQETTAPFELAIALALYYGSKYESLDVQEVCKLLVQEFSVRISVSTSNLFKRLEQDEKIETLLDNLE